MEIKRKGDSKNGVFFIEDGGQQLGTMTYFFKSENVFVIEHTIVNPGNEGKGLGKTLVKAGVEFARENNYKVVPQCPYAKTIFEKTSDFADVLNVN
jgi:uncharacterized protein